MTEAENVKVFEDTLRQIDEKYGADKSKAVYYNGNIPRRESNFEHTPITMVHGGTVNIGYANSGTMRTAILNFADAIRYGGWVEHGAQTQEENICRCTNIFRILGNEESNEKYYAPNRDTLKNRSPFDDCHYGNSDEVYTNRIIYIRDAIVFKDDTTYSEVEPRQLDVITCPAPSARLSVYDAMPIFISRIEQIVLSAIENKAECIVLGAWGCGAFCQSPEIVARAFAEVLNKYSGYFKKVVFAIKPTTNWGAKDLYDTFKFILGKYYRGEVTDEK